MTHHFVVKLLKKLSPQEKKDFRIYAKKDKNVRPQALKLLAYIESTSQENLDFRQAHRSTFGRSTTFKLVKIQNLLSTIKRSSLCFLIEQKLYDSAVWTAYFEALVLHDFEMTPHFLQKTTKYLTENPPEKTPPGQIPLSLDLMDRLLATGHLLNKDHKLTLVQSLHPAIDRYFILQKLKGALYLRFNEQQVDLVPTPPTDISFIQAILVHIPEHFSDDPLVMAYYFAYLLDTTDLDDPFDQLISRLGQTDPPPALQSELDNILVTMLNRTVDKINTNGSTQNYRRAFELYKLGLQKGIIVANNSIAPRRFLNINNTACRLQEFDWASSFIKNYQSYLPEEIRVPAAELAQAILFIEQGTPLPAIKVLMEFKSAQEDLRFTAELMLYKALFINNKTPHPRQANYPDLVERINSYMRTVKKSRKIKKVMREGAANYMWIIREMEKGRKSRNDIRKEMGSMNYVYSRKWLENELASYNSISS